MTIMYYTSRNDNIIIPEWRGGRFKLQAAIYYTIIILLFPSTETFIIQLLTNVGHVL